MAFDETLADRIRAVVGPRTDLSERKMFGGIAFLLGGKMFAGLAGDELMLRLGPAAEAALAEPHVRPMDFTGRPMKGYVFVHPKALRGEKALKSWIDRAIIFVETVEKKPAKKRKKAPFVGLAKKRRR